MYDFKTKHISLPKNAGSTNRNDTNSKIPPCTLYWRFVQDPRCDVFEAGGSACKKSKLGWDTKNYFSDIFVSFCTKSLFCPKWIKLSLFWVKARFIRSQQRLSKQTNVLLTLRFTVTNVTGYSTWTHNACKLLSRNSNAKMIYTTKTKVHATLTSQQFEQKIRKCSMHTGTPHIRQANLVLFRCYGRQIWQRILACSFSLTCTGIAEISPGNVLWMVDRMAGGSTYFVELARTLSFCTECWSDNHKCLCFKKCDINGESRSKQYWIFIVIRAEKITGRFLYADSLYCWNR